MIHFRFGNGTPLEYSLLGAIIFFAMAALFVLSYFFEGRSKWFGCVMYFCKELSFPGVKIMAFAYAGLCILVGCLLITESQ